MIRSVESYTLEELRSFIFNWDDPTYGIIACNRVPADQSRYGTLYGQEEQKQYVVPTLQEYMEFSIKRCGCVTDWLHNAEVGQEICVRGPIGNGFPVDTKLKGKDILVIAGGIGIAPVHSVVNYMLDKRSDYGKIQVIYGSRSKADLVRLDEMQNVWMKQSNCSIDLTIDREEEGWDGHVGFVQPYVTELNPDPSMTVIMCGPPVLIHLSLDALIKLGFKKEQIFTTMEMRMKCG
ncbi:MAG: hypothetical protein IKZ39_08120, partial [Lachnospiraceae bacterium]|nr:hypothetical protein [Lachnospiraceae bacterium]